MKRIGQMALWLRLLCAIALVCLAFAHRPFTPADTSSFPSASEMAAYRLPDGKLPVLCITVDAGSGKTQEHGKNPDCEACRLSASAALPARPSLPEPTLSPVREPARPLETVFVPQTRFLPNAAPRAPPLSFMIG